MQYDQILSWLNNKKETAVDPFKWHLREIFEHLGGDERSGPTGPVKVTERFYPD